MTIKGTAVTVEYPDPDPRVEALRDIIAAAEAELARLGLPPNAWRDFDPSDPQSGPAFDVVETGSRCGEPDVTSRRPATDIDVDPILGARWRTIRRGRPSPAFQKLSQYADRLRKRHPDWSG